MTHVQNNMSQTIISGENQIYSVPGTHSIGTDFDFYPTIKHHKWKGRNIACDHSFIHVFIHSSIHSFNYLFTLSSYWSYCVLRQMILIPLPLV